MKCKKKKRKRVFVSITPTQLSINHCNHLLKSVSQIHSEILTDISVSSLFFPFLFVSSSNQPHSETYSLLWYVPQPNLF